MAAKKTTKKSTTKKASTKSKNVFVTYDPVGFTAEQMSFPLRTKEFKGGVLVDVPLVEGLPMDFTVRKGEKVELTPTQLEQLQAVRVVESDEEYKMRKDFIKNIPNQYPNTANDENTEAVKSLLTENDLQFRIYNDRLIICD